MELGNQGPWDPGTCDQMSISKFMKKDIDFTKYLKSTGGA